MFSSIAISLQDGNHLIHWTRILPRRRPKNVITNMARCSILYQSLMALKNWLNQRHQVPRATTPIDFLGFLFYNGCYSDTSATWHLAHTHADIHTSTLAPIIFLLHNTWDRLMIHANTGSEKLVAPHSCQVHFGRSGDWDRDSRFVVGFFFTQVDHSSIQVWDCRTFGWVFADTDKTISLI